MTPETTTQEFRAQLLHGWLVSCLLHGLLLFSFLPFFRHSLITVPQELFHWDVALIQSIDVADKPAQSVNTTEPAVSKLTKQTSTHAPTNRRIQHAASPAVPTASSEPKADAPIASELKPDIPSSATSPTESTMASSIEEPRPNLPPASNSTPQQAESQASTTTQEPSASEAVVAAPNETGNPTTETGPPSPSQTTASAPDSLSRPQPDYGWLQQAIFQRLEDLKRSSRPRVDQSQPLKVLVRAVVSQEGALLDAEVVKSSGLDRIDQEAMALVQRAFPIQLDRTLDRRQIAMRIPITYSRE